VQNEGKTVTLQTKVVTSSITNTVGDSEPLAVYAVSKFLQPMELFKVVEAPAPAPEPSKKKANAADDSGDGTSDPTVRAMTRPMLFDRRLFCRSTESTIE
jgi:hypothetical protein